MKTLVTGASGILGGVLMKRLGAKAVGVSRRGTGPAGPHRCLDLSDAAKVKELFDREKPSLVINPAAYSDVDGCERDAAQAWKSNAESVKILASLCAEKKVPLLHVSTDYVFDGRKTSPYLETDLVGPVNVYGMTKLAGEYFALAAPAGAVVRTSWLYGPGNPANFVNAIAERLKIEPVVRVLDDQVDSPTYAEDLAAALEKIGERLADPGIGNLGVFQFCNSGSPTRLEMALELKKILGLDVRVERFDKNELKGRLAVRPAYGVMSASKAESFLGVRMRPWQDALREYLAPAKG